MDHPTKSTYLLLTIAELFFICQFLLVWYPGFGIFTSAGLIIVLIFFALKRPIVSALTSVICLLFAVRLATATFAVEDPSIAPFILYGVMGIGALIHLIICARSRNMLSYPPDQASGRFALMILAGQFLGLIAYLFLPTDDPYRVLPKVALIAAAPLAAAIEEYLFRSTIQSQSTKITDTTTGILFTTWIAAAFALSKSTPVVFVMLTTHFILSVLYARTQNAYFTFTANLAMKLTFIALLSMRPTFV